MKPWDEGGLKDKSKELSSSLCKLTAQRGGGKDLDSGLLVYKDSLSNKGKSCEKNYSSVRRYVADPVNVFPELV
ncbi:hypothetical protein Tco_0927137 [Tanacetum coccineum]|uniref:Uncharacterized protein n=1 Tax=Tanacetum coccineum TaxID=301880 RepID=A0ABQ5DEJ1_9ASTR